MDQVGAKGVSNLEGLEKKSKQRVLIPLPTPGLGLLKWLPLVITDTDQLATCHSSIRND